MAEHSDWPRVPITIPPVPPRLSREKTELALFAICQALWAKQKVPVVAWGSAMDGTELLPPRTQ